MLYLSSIAGITAYSFEISLRSYLMSLFFSRAGVGHDGEWGHEFEPGQFRASGGWAE